MSNKDWHTVRPTISDPEMAPVHHAMPAKPYPQVEQFPGEPNQGEGFIKRHFMAVVACVVLLIIVIVVLYVYLTRDKNVPARGPEPGSGAGSSKKPGPARPPGSAPDAHVPAAADPTSPEFQRLVAERRARRSGASAGSVAGPALGGKSPNRGGGAPQGMPPPQGVPMRTATPQQMTQQIDVLTNQVLAHQHMLQSIAGKPHNARVRFEELPDRDPLELGHTPAAVAHEMVSQEAHGTLETVTPDPLDDPNLRKDAVGSDEMDALLLSMVDAQSET